MKVAALATFCLVPLIMCKKLLVETGDASLLDASVVNINSTTAQDYAASHEATKALRRHASC